MTRCVAIIQARSGSSRLPGKALLPLGERTALGLMVHRVKKAEQISEIIIATTENTGDDILCDEARKLAAAAEGSMAPFSTNPLVDASRLECGVYTPKDGDVDPTMLTTAISKYAKARTSARSV